MRWLALLLMATLAGCADESAPAAPDEPAFDGFDLEATDDTGIIRGVVVDQAIVPIAEATVTLQSGEQTESNEGGAFGFAALEPGSYFMTIEREGYITVQQSVEVVAGVAAPPVVRVQMAEDPSTVPFAAALVWDGYMACGLSALALCGLPVVDEAVGEDFIETLEIERGGVTYLQSEMLWESTQAVSENMQLWQEAEGDDGRCTFAAQNGPSPNVINTTHGDYNTHGTKECFDSLGETRDLRLRVFSGSIDGTFPPTDNGCYPGVPGVTGGLCMGVGFTLEQSFTVYNHVFYGFKPFENWQFSIDGHPVPPS